MSPPQGAAGASPPRRASTLAGVPRETVDCFDAELNTTTLATPGLLVTHSRRLAPPHHRVTRFAGIGIRVQGGIDTPLAEIDPAATVELLGRLPSWRRQFHHAGLIDILGGALVQIGRARASTPCCFAPCRLQVLSNRIPELQVSYSLNRPTSHAKKLSLPDACVHRSMPAIVIAAFLTSLEPSIQRFALLHGP